MSFEGEKGLIVGIANGAGIEDVGNVAAFLASDAAAALTGSIEYIDTGYHILR